VIGGNEGQEDALLIAQVRPQSIGLEESSDRAQPVLLPRQLLSLDPPCQRLGISEACEEDLGLFRVAKT